MNITYEMLKSIPYVNHKAIVPGDDRLAIIMPFFDGTEWIIPIPTTDKILLSKGGTPEASTYISNNIVDPKNDLYLFCIDFLYKYASWNDIHYHINGLINDFGNLFTVVNKIDTYFCLENKHFEVSDFVRTELEYLYIVCKSIYDTLQKIICIIWNTKITLLNDIEKKNLPEKYRNVVIQNGKVRKADEIKQQYNLPDDFVNYYLDQIDFYENLKIIRDDIVHHEKTIDFIFNLENGFAISEDTLLFKRYKIWNKDEKKENGLYSIRPLLSYLINNTIRSCNDYCKCISKIIAFSQPLILDSSVFLRNPHIKSFVLMEESLKKSTWW